MDPAIGILTFLGVVVALIGLTYLLSRKYARGTDRRGYEDTAREIALRDGNAGMPTGGFLPQFGNDNPSPRQRLHGPPDE